MTINSLRRRSISSFFDNSFKIDAPCFAIYQLSVFAAYFKHATSRKFCHVLDVLYIVARVLKFLLLPCVCVLV